MAEADAILAALAELKSLLVVLVGRETPKDFYEVEEFARLVGKATYTVREWCRRRRVHAVKRYSGRGAHAAWAISHEEFQRYQREGLLLVQAKQRKRRPKEVEVGIHSAAHHG